MRRLLKTSGNKFRSLLHGTHIFVGPPGRRFQGRFILSMMALLFWVACSDGFIPEGLYPYQVSRLLTAGDEKTWEMQNRTEGGRTESPSTCADSMRLHMTFQSDSVLISRIEKDCGNGKLDTIVIGQALPSSGPLYFSDSLHFASGAFWSVVRITSQQFDFVEGEISYQLVSNLQAGQ